MQLSYKKLFEINIFHDYYNGVSEGQYNVHNDLDFILDSPTKQLIKNYRLRLIKNSTGLLVLAQAELINLSDPTQGYKTKISITEDIKFNFFIRIKNSFFSNYTNLRLIKEQNEIYYFNNRSENIVNINATDVCFLSQTLPSYPTPYSGTDYELGDLFTDGGGVTYEAITNFTPPGLGPTPADTNNINWEVIGNTFQYITALDLIKTSNALFNYRSSNTNPGELITFTLRDISNNVLTIFDSTKTADPVNPIQAPLNPTDDIVHQLNLNFLKQGLYQINVQHAISPVNQDATCFIYDKLTYPGIFGTIEIYTGTGVPNDYSFIENDTDADGRPFSRILEKTYQIRFKNRLTLWEYEQADGTAIVIANNRPRPLQKLPSEFNPNGTLLPDPAIYQIIPERNTVNNQLIDNIYSKTYIQ